jgi:hypothetical protein
MTLKKPRADMGFFAVFYYRFRRRRLTSNENSVPIPSKPIVAGSGITDI